MNISDIRKLVEIIKANDLTEFELDEEDISIRIKRGTESVPVAAMPQVQPAMQPAPVAQTSAPAPDSAGAPVQEVGVEIISSPMVGTFYRAPSPESPPFASEGTVVSPDSVICIIEAMKVMNEIQAEIKGTVVEVMVSDGEAVEFGQPLFKVKTA